MIRFHPTDWPPCEFRVRYAACQENILHGHGWHRHRHRYWVVEAGGVPHGVRVNGRIFSRKKTSVTVYAPGVTYEENVESGRLIPFRWVLLEAKTEASVLQKMTGAAGYVLLDDKAGLIARTIEEIVRIGETSLPGKAYLLSGCVSQVIGLLVNLKSETSGEKKALKQVSKKWVHPWKRAVCLELERTFPQTLSLRMMANKMNVSTSTLTHSYKKVCGETFRETVHAWRLEKVHALLERDDLSIKEIAMMLGFAHQSYLCAFLQQATGCSPTELRRMAYAGKIAKGGNVKHGKSLINGDAPNNV